MKKIFLGAFVAAISLFASPSALGAIFNSSRTIDIDGKQRRYVLYIPDGVSANAPLVVSLHGAAGHDTDRSPFRTSVADEVKCIVAYPQGENQNFGPFGTVPGWNATGEHNEEARFLKAIVDDIASTYTIDRDRIYCCGFSNGGMMTYAAANACGDFFAAFAAISGFPLNEFHHQFTGARPVPFLHIHGKADDFVKYSCMPIIRDAMVGRNGCNPVPTVTEVAGQYRKSIYSPLPGAESFPYEYIEVDGMGHNDYTDRTPDGNSAKTMWQFFKRFSLSSPCDKTLKWRQPLDLDGFNPSQHGWKVNDTATRLEYGTNAAPGNADNNVYHSLQFRPGDYSLSVALTGSTGEKLYVKIETLDGQHLFTKACDASRDAVIPFNVKTAGLYRIIIVKSSHAIKVTDLKIQSTATPVQAVNAVDSTLPGENAEPQEPALDPSFIEITQDQGKQHDTFTRTAMEAANGYTLYTATGDLQIAFKMLDIDIKDCDYVVIKFAEAVKGGWKVAWHEGQDLDDIPAGSTEVKITPTEAMIAAGKLPQLTMMTFFGTATPLTAKVKGVYKHSITNSGIDKVTTDATASQWIDLQGRVYPTPSRPGIYIHEGRKVLIR